MSLRMMIVDDSPDQRVLLRIRFERIGCEVVAEAGDGAEAVDLFHKFRPDLVTLDIIMPTVRGIDALSAFHAIRADTPRARIIIVSAVPVAKTAELFMAEGAFALIEKPVTHTRFRALQRRIAAAYPDVVSHQLQ